MFDHLPLHKPIQVLIGSLQLGHQLLLLTPEFCLGHHRAWLLLYHVEDFLVDHNFSGPHKLFNQFLCLGTGHGPLLHCFLIRCHFVLQIALGVGPFHLMPPFHLFYAFGARIAGPYFFQC